MGQNLSLQNHTSGTSPASRSLCPFLPQSEDCLFFRSCQKPSAQPNARLSEASTDQQDLQKVSSDSVHFSRIKDFSNPGRRARFNPDVQCVTFAKHQPPMELLSEKICGSSSADEVKSSKSLSEEELVNKTVPHWMEGYSYPQKLASFMGSSIVRSPDLRTAMVYLQKNLLDRAPKDFRAYNMSDAQIKGLAQSFKANPQLAKRIQNLLLTLRKISMAHIQDAQEMRALTKALSGVELREVTHPETGAFKLELGQVTVNGKKIDVSDAVDLALDSLATQAKWDASLRSAPRTMKQFLLGEFSLDAQRFRRAGSLLNTELKNIEQFQESQNSAES